MNYFAFKIPLYMKKLMIFVAIAAIAVTSCKKDDDGPASVKPTQSNLAGSWKTAGASLNGTDYWGSIPACQKDDIYQLTATGTYTFTDAGTTCSTPPDTYNGTYMLNAAADSIMMSMDGAYKIRSFNGSTIVLEETYSVGGSSFVTTSTLVKQ